MSPHETCTFLGTFPRCKKLHFEVKSNYIVITLRLPGRITAATGLVFGDPDQT